jgi:ribosomal-protein-alanine N-acetyltransferase
MPTRYTLRRLRLSDLDRILEIESASFGKEAYDRNLFADFFHNCGDLFLVAVRGRRICGYIVTCMGRQRAELISIAVDPKDRGKGAASVMMEGTIRRLRRRAVPRMFLMVRLTNAAARSFYEKYGFRKLRSVREYYEDGEAGVLMSKDLH